MEADLIDPTPLQPGWGQIWQGPTPDAAVDSLPGPLMILCMNPEPDEQFVDHITVDCELYVGIDDSPSACLLDWALRGVADAAIAWLKVGGNIFLHCQAGISRASYMDCAIHQRAMGWDFPTALAYVRKARPVANPNVGFTAQLMRLGPWLAGVSPPV
jgi:hypothetical protein